MMRCLSSVVLLLAGVALGWWLRGPAAVVAPADMAAFEAGASADAAAGVAFEAATRAVPPGPQGAAGQRPRPEPEIDTTVSVSSFRDLLAGQDFEQAVAYYEQALDFGEGYQVLLKPALEDYLQTCLRQCREGVFTSLVDVWLATYYDDIPVLLLLAQYQQQQGFPEEAVKVLHMANTYAYQAGQREQVSLALRRLVKSTDDYLAPQQRWIELLGFYELVEAVGVTEPAFLFRQAMIYRTIGEPGRSRDMLLALRASDNELDPRWTQAIDSQLAEIAPEPEAEPVPANAIPLMRQGDHFLVETRLNNRKRLVLMIDSGASITSISRSSFDNISSASFQGRGSRLFNTASGITHGDVFSVDSLELGNARINDIEVAVLDYEPRAGVDGLLGMNVLRNYRFEIDQENALLYLQPR